MRHFLWLAMIVLLAGCGGPKRVPDSGSNSVVVAQGMPIAYGPIAKACMASGRKGANARLCGCIQAAADQSLSRSDQRRSLEFYNDPHKAQVVRQSDRAADEQFWKAYSAYADRAEKMCG
ncbi:MAG: hypothetical protein RIG84_06885 [Roseovarius sp.]